MLSSEPSSNVSLCTPPDWRGAQRLTAGGFITVPKDAHHFAVARGVTIIQVHGEGPFQITARPSRAS